MIMDYKINENKINQILDELNEDRNKLFNDIKTSKMSDKIKEDKIRYLEQIQKNLLNYKKVLTKEREKNEL